jgi:organic radical activating enzyme
MDMSPVEFLNSPFRRELKEKFSQGEFPDACHTCKHREHIGLRSTRMHTNLVMNKLNPDVQQYKLDDDPEIMRLELRFSNLCNFKCRMCEPYSSSEIAKEILEHPELDTWKFNETESVLYTTDENIEELKTIADTIDLLCLTGGEPFLIKQYYDFLDYLIDSGRSKDVKVELFTNCSVNNPLFIKRLEQFKEVRFIMSIDGVGKTAEYIRYGTKWDVVEGNVLQFVELKHPFKMLYNTAISQYTLFDMVSLSNFLIRLYEINNELDTRCYSVITPSVLHVDNMSKAHRQIALEQIDKSIGILYPDNFKLLTDELKNIKARILSTEPNNPQQFVEFNRQYDRIRNQSFEEVFGFSLD